jgi:nicotinate-nucleotide pyrophosphorylase (carboxylating)
VEKSEKYNIAILDTRKTLPGYRAFDKYAVRAGGGQNHRFGQADVWMAKDNHKAFFGGLRGAIDFFKSMGSFYAPVVVEIHDLAELKEAVKLGVRHVMLDNFSPTEVQAAIAEKSEGMTYEISGGITLESIEKYLIKGVDAISVGSLTYGAPPVDISFKYSR